MRTLVTILVMAVVVFPVTANATIINIPGDYPTIQKGIDQKGPGDTLWTRAYGGTDKDEAYSVQQTTDGGYIVAGWTTSFGASDYDFFVVKTDASGDTLWTRTPGGNRFDYGYSVQQTSDGGYVIGGATISFGAGGYDFYLVKTDANGNTLWTRTYGGSMWDEGYSVQQTTDGGYILAGYTMSFGAGYMNIYLVKTDANGNTLWTRAYGPSGNHVAYCVQQTTDGGYIVAGYTNTSFEHWLDVYLVKTDSSGDTLWTRTYGGSSGDYGYSVQETSEGGYIIAGYTGSFGAGGYDVYLVKTDSSGDTLWTRTYGGSHYDYGYSVQQTSDGGYIIGSSGFADLVKTDSSGNIIWTGDCGMPAKSVQQTSDGGYVIAGETRSFGEGYPDVYLVKTDSFGDTVWTRTYGGEREEYGESVQQTSDGGYIIAGWTTSFGVDYSDVYLVRVAGEELPAVSIELVPDQSPVVVPRGGSFGFTGTVTNNTDVRQRVDIWLMAYVPGIGMYGPLRDYSNIPFNPHQSRSAHLNQNIPNIAPISDEYIYYGYVGEYPTLVIDSSYFPFEVTAKGLAKAGVSDWTLTGSFLEGGQVDLPTEFALSSNYPNPFNAKTVIDYQLPAVCEVKIEVYNLLGEKVATLVNGAEEAGYKSVTWDASEISSGPYFYKLTAGDYTETKRMMLIK